MVKNVFKKLGKKQKNNKGFSLVELIVVIAIMAVLVGVLAPQLIRYVEKSREATDIQNCDSIATTLKTYFSDQEGITGDITVVVPKSGSGVTVTASGDTGSSTTIKDKAVDAITKAGLNTTVLKGTKWGDSGITIKYSVTDGKVSYTAESEHYTTTNGSNASNDQIKAK